MKVGDLVVCISPEVSVLPMSRYGLIHAGGVYRVSRMFTVNYLKNGPRDEIRLEADDTGAPSASHPQAWFRPLLAYWHVNLNWWCLSCGRWEPDQPGDFLACGECSHVFRTAGDLVAEENNIRQRMGDVLPQLVDPLRDALSQIYSCPLCTHDW